jgi:hypothetical protein
MWELTDVLAFIDKLHASTAARETAGGGSPLGDVNHFAALS